MGPDPGDKHRDGNHEPGAQTRIRKAGHEAAPVYLDSIAGTARPRYLTAGFVAQRLGPGMPGPYSMGLGMARPARRATLVARRRPAASYRNIAFASLGLARRARFVHWRLPDSRHLAPPLSDAGFSPTERPQADHKEAGGDHG